MDQLVTMNQCLELYWDPGCGGGLVINKKIISGANGLAGEWSLNQMPLTNTPNLKSDKILNFSK